jgi:hypothetical protein
VFAAVAEDEATITELLALGDRFAHEVSPWGLGSASAVLRFDH